MFFSDELTSVNILFVTEDLVDMTGTASKTRDANNYTLKQESLNI